MTEVSGPIAFWPMPWYSAEISCVTVDAVFDGLANFHVVSGRTSSCQEHLEWHAHPGLARDLQPGCLKAWQVLRSERRGELGFA